MRSRRIRTLGLAVGAGTATIVVGALVGLGIIAIASNLGIEPPPAGEVPQVTAAPRPTPTQATGIVLEMPIGDDCVACHTTVEGGVGNVPVPPIGHPLEGWTSCTSCHANNALVQTAPGHVGIHADQCLLCHKATTPAAESRPHSVHQDVPCLSCHGSRAPLPPSMQGRSEETCFLCHQGSSQEAPLYIHPTPADGKCLTCHVAGKVGALPDDHAGRTDDQCSACHHQAAEPAPSAPHDLASREGMCTFCHGSAGPQ